MKRVFMFGCGGFVALIVLIIVVIAMTGTTGGASNSSAATNDDAVQAQLGVPFKLGDFQYTVTGAAPQAAIGNQIVNEQSSQGATFLIVSYSIENLGKQTATAMASDFYLLDASGIKYQPSTRGQTALTMVNKGDLVLTQLQPGIVKQSQQVFELPQKALETKGLLLLIPEKGFGSGKATIPLN